MTAEWVVRQIRVGGRFGTAALGGVLGRCRAALARVRFRCQAEQVIDESCPPYEDQFLCVQISGRFSIAQSHCDTDVRVQLLDVTDGGGQVEQVLTVSPQWRRPESPVFHYQAHNGVIPGRHVALRKPISVAKIPLHLLRFARRGRRRIQVVVGIIDRNNGRLLAQTESFAEFVFCGEGFVEMQEHHEAVLRAGVELACAVVADQAIEPRVAEVIGDWIKDKTTHFTPRSDIAEPLTRLSASKASVDVDAACECVLAWGNKTDATAALELVLQVAAMYPAISCWQEALLWELADKLNISQERFVLLCQKRLLTESCSVDCWRLLVGVRQELSPEQLRQTLNEEYRKWNARVTHADTQVRRQADIILSIIAEVRSRRQVVLTT